MGKTLMIDSGIGGLCVLQKTLQKCCGEFVYLADSKYFPYGTKSKEQLLSRLIRLVKHFDCQQVVLACNTASTLAKQLQLQTDTPIVEIITPTCAYVEQMGYSNICLLATHLTVNSKVYQNRLKTVGCDVKAFSCDKLVKYAENGYTQNDLKTELADIAKNVDNATQCLLLGCTHFGLLRNQIQQQFDNLPIVDCSTPMAQLLANTLPTYTMQNSSVTYLTTGDLSCAQRLSIKTEKTFSTVNI